MIFSLSECRLEGVCAHVVGNAQNAELVLSSSPLDLDENSRIILCDFFVKSFCENGLYRFTHTSELGLNTVYTYVRRLFREASLLHKQSENLARFLMEKSNHPQIRVGEFYVARFSGCLFDSKSVDAIGMFKSETKDVFLNVSKNGRTISVQASTGVNVDKLDKGAIIFNVEEESGYQVAVVDKTSKKGDAKYWVDDFLQLAPRNNSFSYTRDYLNLTKSFIRNSFADGIDASKTDQAKMLNDTVRFFRENDAFDLKDFERQVIVNAERIESFHRYKEEYSISNGVELADEFSISDVAYKKQLRSMRSVIKLDKNFHIYVHGGEQMIRKGYDAETGMSYYQIYFKEES